MSIFRLFAVVVHIGHGPNRGHYVAVVKSGGRWLLFDDDVVELVNEQVCIPSFVCFILCVLFIRSFVVNPSPLALAPSCGRVDYVDIVQ